MKPYYLSQKEIKAVEEFKQKVSSVLPGQIVELKLFGSKARGNYKKDSDIDLLLIVRRDSEKLRDKVFDEVTKIAMNYGMYLSVHIYSLREFKKLSGIPTVFMREVAQAGITL